MDNFSGNSQLSRNWFVPGIETRTRHFPPSVLNIPQMSSFPDPVQRGNGLLEKNYYKTSAADASPKKHSPSKQLRIVFSNPKCVCTCMYIRT